MMPCGMVYKTGQIFLSTRSRTRRKHRLRSLGLQRSPRRPDLAALWRRPLQACRSCLCSGRCRLGRRSGRRGLLLLSCRAWGRSVGLMISTSFIEVVPAFAGLVRHTLIIPATKFRGRPYRSTVSTKTRRARTCIHAMTASL